MHTIRVLISLKEAVISILMHQLPIGSLSCCWAAGKTSWPRLARHVLLIDSFICWSDLRFFPSQPPKPQSEHSQMLFSGFSTNSQLLPGLWKHCSCGHRHEWVSFSFVLQPWTKCVSFSFSLISRLVPEFAHHLPAAVWYSSSGQVAGKSSPRDKHHSLAHSQLLHQQNICQECFSLNYSFRLQAAATV